jgi:3D (Asp-Asp-Asp) domain-containing protein
MTRRLTPTLAAALLLLGALLPAPAARAAASGLPVPPPIGEAIRYDDVPENNWAYWPVAKLREAGILSADPSGRFRPNDPVRRDEFLKMLLAARRVDTSGTCHIYFADVPCSAWFAPAAETAYGMGITEGRDDSTFDPDARVTRQELFTTVVRALGQRFAAEDLSDGEVDGALQRFTDARQIASWARPFAALALRSGLTAGYEDGSFRPGQLATRAEAAVVIGRLLVTPGTDNTVHVDGRTIVFKRTLTVTASMYATGEPGVGSRTATGLQVRHGTVAVDPRVIPLGTLLYIEGYGYAIAADTGGAIKGNRIDLYTDSYEQAMNFGMQSRRVWVIS